MKSIGYAAQAADQPLAQQIHPAYERLLKRDVNYSFVINMASLVNA